MYIRRSRVMPPLLPTTLRPPPLECPHLVERESQRLRKLGNGVPASFPRPAFHIPYGGRGYPTLLGELLYGKPPLLPYPPQLQAQTFFAHAALFNAASTASTAAPRPRPTICSTSRSPDPGAGGHTPSPHSFRKSISSSRCTLMLAGSGPTSGCGPRIRSSASSTVAVYPPRVTHRSTCGTACGFNRSPRMPKGLCEWWQQRQHLCVL